MKKTCVLVLGSVLALFGPEKIPAQAAAPVSAAVARAFSDAGLPMLRRRAAPVDFSAPRPDGTTLKLSDLRGKVVFMNFWATWCGPCRQEMPSMEALYQRLKSQGLVILAVNSQEAPRDVSAYLQSSGLSFETVLDTSGKISRSYGISALPSSFILDREGKIVTQVVGSINWNEPRIAAAFEALLKE